MEQNVTVWGKPTNKWIIIGGLIIVVVATGLIITYYVWYKPKYEKKET